MFLIADFLMEGVVAVRSGKEIIIFFSLMEINVKDKIDLDCSNYIV